MNDVLCGKTIDNVAQQNDNRLLNNMEKAQIFAEKLQCVEFCLFDSQVAPFEKQVETAAAKKHNKNIR